jgi:hypothetical protein
VAVAIVVVEQRVITNALFFCSAALIAVSLLVATQEASGQNGP